MTRPDWTLLCRRRRLSKPSRPGRPIMPSEFVPLVELAREQGISTAELRRLRFLTRQ